MAKQSFRVWKLRTGTELVPPDSHLPFCVDAETHEEAASQIAMELSMGGFFRVHAAAIAGDAKIVRIVPVTTYEATEIAEAGLGIQKAVKE